jgi:hypothetical protein
MAAQVHKKPVNLARDLAIIDCTGFYLDLDATIIFPIANKIYKKIRTPQDHMFIQLYGGHCLGIKYSLQEYGK